MTLLDIILVLLLLLFTATGFRLGALHALGAVLGFVVGLMIADTYYIQVSEKLSFIHFGHELLLRVIVYGLIVLIVSRLVGLFFWLIEKLIGLVPLLGTFNMVIGAFAGFTEGVLVLGFVLSMILRFPYISVVTEEIAKSSVAPQIVAGFSVVTSLLPQDFTKLEMVDIESWKRVQSLAGDRWKEYQNLHGEEGAKKLQELKHMLP